MALIPKRYDFDLNASIEFHDGIRHFVPTESWKVRFITANQPIDLTNTNDGMCGCVSRVQHCTLRCYVRWRIHTSIYMCVCAVCIPMSALLNKNYSEQRKTFKSHWLMAWPQSFTQLHFEHTHTHMDATVHIQTLAYRWARIFSE